MAQGKTTAQPQYSRHFPFYAVALRIDEPVPKDLKSLSEFKM